jgi:hypothetical protein
MTDVDHQRRSHDSAAWALIALLVAGIAAAELYSPLAIEPVGLVNLGIATAVLGGAIHFYRRVRINEHLAATCNALLQALTFSAAGSILSYLLARGGGPFWDSTLYAWDRSLGFDWLGYVRLIDAQAWLVLPLQLAYASLIPQVVVVILALGFGGRLDQLRTFILAAIGSGAVAIVLSAIFPALSNYVHLGLTAQDFQNVDPWAGYVHLHDLTMLRTGQLTVLNLPEMQGIITFPSYHACLATLSLWAFWNSGRRAIRWLGATVALGTIAATPVDGGHYFVDVIAGIGIAVVSLALARRLIFVRIGMPGIRAWPSRRLREASAR